MSRRTADASKAIRLAWEKEQQRVLEGEGTRDWTKKQQQDIIDRGKAYDEDGKAFEGQHMKSAAEYPEYQVNPIIYNSLLIKSILRLTVGIGRILQIGIMTLLPNSSMILVMESIFHAWYLNLAYQSVQKVQRC